MSLGRACISTKRQSTLFESVSVIIHGKSFDVHVHEIGAWSTIINDEYRELDEKDGEAESHTSNEEENPMDTLDDFVEQVVEEKGKSHSTNEGSHIETASSGGKPPGFENVVKKEDILHSVPTKEDSVIPRPDQKDGCKNGARVPKEDVKWDRLGFSSTWRKWIMAGLKSSRASILVNGSPTSEFSLKRGLRQGDPLSPFLFIIVMEGLHIDLKDGLTEIFSKVLRLGLKINISKSNLYGVGVSSDDIESMAAGTGYSASNLPFSYLGLPIGSNMNRIANWNGLIECFKFRLSGWKANMLSSGGCLTLIKSVLGSLGIYYFFIFKVLEAVLKTLETGIELKGCQTNGLWTRIVGMIYHLYSSGYVPLNSLRYQFDDGSMIRFWKDTWLGDAPLCSRFNRLFRLEKNKNFLVRDRIVNGLWAWDWHHPVNGGRALVDLNNLLIDIGSLNVEVDRDCVISSLSIDGSYLVSFIRKHIDNCMIANSLLSTRWCKIIPRKVNIFMWRLLLDRLPHRLNISSRGLDIDSILCPLPIFGGLFVVGVTLKSRRYLPVMNGTYGTPRGKLQKSRKTDLMSFSPPLVG
ncbi:RNA-directed DNA polymerase, eukaryota, reverse transcriptase zinc-binding domain protein [Tanacetum coccineum]